MGMGAGFNSDPFSEYQAVPERQAAMQRFLASRVGDIHPGLQDLSPFAVGGMPELADRMYADIVGAEPAGESPHLPYGAVPCTDDEAVVTLRELHMMQLERFMATSWPVQYATLLRNAHYPSHELQTLVSDVSTDEDLGLFAEWLHPTIQGREWHRGHIVRLNRGRVCIAEPFMHLGEQGGCPFPLAFLLEDPPLDEVRQLAYDLREAARDAW